jgi:hypothetical protein
MKPIRTILTNVLVLMTRQGLFRAALLAAAGMTCACTAPVTRNIADSDPSAKIPAIKASVEGKDFAAVGQLVKDLESDDPAVRFYAINGLQRLAKENFGYQYFGEEETRRVAVMKWKAWLAGWEAAHREGTTPP